MTTCLDHKNTRWGSSKQLTKVLSFSGMFSNKAKFNPASCLWCGPNNPNYTKHHSAKPRIFSHDRRTVVVNLRTHILERLLQLGRETRTVQETNMYKNLELYALIGDQKLMLVLAELSDEEIVEMVFFPVVNETCRVYFEGIVVKAADLDIAGVMGMGFPPYRGGVMF